MELMIVLVLSVVLGPWVLALWLVGHLLFKLFGLDQQPEQKVCPHCGGRR